MKILEINSVCGIRSTGRICTDIAEMAIQYGHECKIAYGREEVPEKYQDISYKICDKSSVYSHALLARSLGNSGFYSTSSTERFIEWIEDYNPDIVHLHNLHGYYINVEKLFDYIKINRKPVIWTLHDCWPFTGHCSYFTAVGCEEWRNGCPKCRNIREYPSCLGIENTRHLFDRKKATFTGVENLMIVTPSYWLKSLVKDSFLKEYPVRVIPNGIDLKVFKPSKNSNKAHITDKPIILGSASAWNKNRGLDDFIQLNEILNGKYQIVLVGLTKKQIKKLPHGILGIERTNSMSELAEIYSEANVLLNLTYEDNFPTINLEALACGTPVITYNTGGSGESINSACGKVVATGDIKGVIKAINEISEIENSQEKCLLQAQQYDKWKCFEKYIELYKECLLNGEKNE